MRILFAASEAAPFCKAGGLGDVIGSLPKALHKAGEDVAVILPLYGSIFNTAAAPNERVRKQREAWIERLETVAYYEVWVGWRHQNCRLARLMEDGITYYFVDNEYYFGHRDQLYGYYDDGERYIFFSQCVLAALPFLGRVDVLHCHDWQTAAVPLLLHHHYGHLDTHRGIKTVFTIHNLRFQGRYGAEIVPELLSLPADFAKREEIEYFGDVNLMKAALYYADAITTVSPTYAQEIRTTWYGEGLDGVLNRFSYKLTGILNGLDMDAVNPATDYRIAFPFTNYEEKKPNKEAFQREFALPVRPEAMMIGFVSRLDNQKGLDLIERVIHDILRLDVQFVLLGTETTAPGARHTHEDFFRGIENNYRDKARSFILFDPTLAQKIYAACDLFLMPSAFEPCGLSQMFAMRYGALPLVRETGGLKDTVVPYNQFTGEGTGFSFNHYNAHEMLHIIEWANELYHDHQEDVWAKLVDHAMACDFSWDKSAQQYIQVYHRL